MFSKLEIMATKLFTLLILIFLTVVLSNIAFNIFLTVNGSQNTALVPSGVESPAPLETPLLLSATGEILAPPPAAAGAAISMPVLLGIFIGVFIFILAIFIIIRSIKENERLINFILMPSVLLSSLIIRIITVLNYSVTPKYDYETYFEFAKALINNQGYLFKDYGALFPHIYGYSKTLSVFFKIFGQGVLQVEWLNVILSFFAGLLIFCIAKNIFGSKAALTSLLLWTFLPSHIFYNLLASTEQLNALLLLLVIYLVAIHESFSNSFIMRIIFFAVIGFLAVIMNSVRPMGLIVLIAVSIYYFIFSTDNKLLKKASILTFLFTYFAFYFLLTNHISFVLQRDAALNPFGYTAYIGMDYMHQGTWDIEAVETRERIYKETSYNANETHSIMTGMAIERFKYNGIKNFHLQLLKNKNMWGVESDVIEHINIFLDREASRYAFNKPVISAMCDAYYYVLLFFCWVYMLLCLIKGAYRPKSNLIMLIILGTVVMYMVVEVIARYHYAALILIIILTGNLINVIGLKKEKLKGEEI